MQTLNEQEWERVQQANVLAKVAYAFESDMDVSDLEDDRETIFSSVDLLSPAGQTDAQTLALMLQEQLDAINNEIRYFSSCWILFTHTVRSAANCWVIIRRRKKKYCVKLYEVVSVYDPACTPFSCRYCSLITPAQCVSELSLSTE